MLFEIEKYQTSRHTRSYMMAPLIYKIHKLWIKRRWYV